MQKIAKNFMSVRESDAVADEGAAAASERSFMIIPVHIRGKTAVCPDSVSVVNGNSDVIISFTFDREWDDSANKTAVIQYNSFGTIVTESIPFSGDYCRLPVISGTDEITIGVIAGNIRTAAPFRIPCRHAITDYPSKNAPVLTDIYNQIMEHIAMQPEPAEPILLLRDADGFALRDADGFALRVGG